MTCQNVFIDYDFEMGICTAEATEPIVVLAGNGILLSFYTCKKHFQPMKEFIERYSNKLRLGRESADSATEHSSLMKEMLEELKMDAINKFKDKHDGMSPEDDD